MSIATSLQSFETSRLESWLQRVIPDFAGPISLEKFSGGQGKP
jgi:hypothetical protein